MSARTVVKAIAPPIIRYCGIAKALESRYGGLGTIFVLHSVGDDFFPDELLSCPSIVLENVLSWLKRNNIRVISVDEAVERLVDTSDGQFCVITLDDGFADNLTQALPIMERYGAPFTVYVANGMFTGEIDAWWLGLAELIRTKDSVALPSLGLQFDCATRLNKKQTFDRLRAIIEAHWDAVLGPVREAIGANGIDSSALARAKGLSIEQLKHLASSPLVTIGAHGIRHINLARAAEDEVEEEMAASRRLLQDILGREVRHFAYAFGACGPREAQIAKRLGFRSAVSLQHGTLFSQHAHHLHQHSRQRLYRTDTPSSLRCKLAGVYRAYYTHFGDPIAHL